MSSTDVAFCRALLRTLRADMKRAKTKSPKNYWTYECSPGHWEFQVTADSFYWHGRAYNAYDARYKGITAWIEKHDPKGFARMEKL